mmetsp:Transcript_47415/g.146282  ORF Transcript_47415/g.146282 Transcript_47415/m.146282 type:complete len:259 (-) Transcript_47415:89-865(-)
MQRPVQRNRRRGHPARHPVVVSSSRRRGREAEAARRRHRPAMRGDVRCRRATRGHGRSRRGSMRTAAAEVLLEDDEVVRLGDEVAEAEMLPEEAEELGARLVVPELVRLHLLALEHGVVQQAAVPAALLALHDVEVEDAQRVDLFELARLGADEELLRAHLEDADEVAPLGKKVQPVRRVVVQALARGEHVLEALGDDAAAAELVDGVVHALRLRVVAELAQRPAVPHRYRRRGGPHDLRRVDLGCGEHGAARRLRWD